MSDVEVKRWENKLLEISLWSIRCGKEFWFFGKEVAESLKYTNTKEAIRDHVDLEDKKSIEEVLGTNYRIVLERSLKLRGEKNLPLDFFQRLQRKQKLISEFGIYSLCMRSKKEKIKPFQRWVYKTIRTIRETGSYTLPQNVTINNPLDLVTRIETLEKRIQSLKKETKTCDKGTQTQEISLKKFKDRLERSIEKVKKVEFELKKSLREISSNPTPSYSSSSYSSPSRRSSSSNDF